MLSETPSLRFRGYVELRDQRFAIDHTFTSPPTSFSLPEIEISQTIELPGVDVATLQASASITLTGTLQARFSDSSWSLDTSGRLRWSARGAIAGRSQSFGDSYSVDLTVDSAGIEAAVREWKWPGTNTVIIPADRDRRFNRAYEPPTERPSALILAPPRSASLALAPNVRAPAASTGTGTIERIARLPSELRRTERTLTWELMTSHGAIQ